MNMSFGWKLRICRKLIKKHYTDNYDNKLWNRAEEVASFRNKIAHHIASSSDEFLAEKHDDG